MSKLKIIRLHLGVTQTVLADGLGCVQGAIVMYEKGRDLPRKRAQKLIEFAATKGCKLSFDHVYGDLPLPPISADDQAADDSPGLAPTEHTSPQASAPASEAAHG